jgi:putative restriction endonuclease
VTQRTVRSTAVAEAIKKLYEHACQVCDLQLEVPGGYYSEGAHIRALGRPHSGPDVPENVLCLCPNHHALFDDGGIYITDDFKGATIVTRSSAL